MDKLVMALGPAFAAGFAIQQLLEIVGFILDKITNADNKKMILGIISFVVGVLLSLGAGLRVLQPLGIPDSGFWSVFWDVFVTALVISAGTEGINSIMKFLGYAKSEKKADAAEELGKATTATQKALTTLK